MAGMDVEAGRAGGRRSVDSQINMIPMIDLLMVTISFLLITAVWSHMSRVNADAAVPGSRDVDDRPPAPEAQLHVLMPSRDRFVLAWRYGTTTIDSAELTVSSGSLEAASGRALRFPELAARIETEWRRSGHHVQATDPVFDRAVVHTDNTTEFRDIVGVMDAISSPRRPAISGSKQAMEPVFHVVFAVD
jgi:biopolymer transport protein ExbD